jgi:hypothetical protein
MATIQLRNFKQDSMSYTGYGWWAQERSTVWVSQRDGYGYASRLHGFVKAQHFLPLQRSVVTAIHLTPRGASGSLLDPGRLRGSSWLRYEHARARAASAAIVGVSLRIGSATYVHPCNTHSFNIPYKHCIALKHEPSSPCNLMQPLTGAGTETTSQAPLTCARDGK